MNRKKLYVKEFSGWLFASLLLPLVSPFIIAFVLPYFAGIVGQVAILDFRVLLNILLNQGVYAFLSIAILLGLFQDYNSAKEVIKGWLILPFFCFLLGLGFLFIDSLGLTYGNSTFSIEEKRKLFIYLSFFSVIFAIGLKLKIIKLKIKEIYRL